MAESVLTVAATFVGTCMCLIALFAVALLVDLWSLARTDILIHNAVADYELRRALDKGWDNFCRECLRLALQERVFKEEPES